MKRLVITLEGGFTNPIMSKMMQFAHSVCLKSSTGARWRTFPEGIEAINVKKIAVDFWPSAETDILVEGFKEKADVNGWGVKFQLLETD